MKKDKISISEMTGKLKGIPAICTNTKSNPFCQSMQKSNSICKYCYSQRMLDGVRKNCEPSWENNSKLLSESILDISMLPKTKPGIFRLMAHGELINNVHAINLMNIIKKNPQTTFAWWTKRKSLVTDLLEKDKPNNLIMVYSNSKIDDPTPSVPKYFDKVFSVYTKDGSESTGNTINCGSKSCTSCMLCYTFNKITHINELIK